jgi:hypothetical protein
MLFYVAIGSEMIGGGLITLERAQVIVHRPDEPTK